MTLLRNTNTNRLPTSAQTAQSYVQLIYSNALREVQNQLKIQATENNMINLEQGTKDAFINLTAPSKVTGQAGGVSFVRQGSAPEPEKVVLIAALLNKIYGLLSVSNIVEFNIIKFEDGFDPINMIDNTISQIATNPLSILLDDFEGPLNLLPTDLAVVEATLTGVKTALAPTISNAVEILQNTANSALGLGSNTVGQTTNIVSGTVDGATDVVDTVVGGVLSTQSGSEAPILSTVDGATDTVSNTVTGVAGGATEVVDGVLGTQSGAEAPAIETVDNTTNVVSETVSGTTTGATDLVDNTVEGALGTVGDTVEGTTELLGDTVDGVTGAVGNLLS